MVTKTFNKRELQAFIDSDFYKELVNVPISYHRAISQIHNPRAKDEHILLVAVFEDKYTLGYLGILPDDIFLQNNKIEVGWLTCFWVDERYKKRNIAAHLFLRAIRAYHQNILITNVATFLESVYAKTKLFHKDVVKFGIRSYLRFNLADVLPPKNNFFNKSKFIFRWSDKIANLLFRRKNIPLLPLAAAHFTFHRLTRANLADAQLLNMHFNNTYTRRGMVEFDWILTFPWVYEKRETVDSRKYFFTSVSNQFITEVFLIKDTQQVVCGFFILNIRDRHLTVPYYFCTPEATVAVTDFIINKMIAHQVCMCTVFNEQLRSGFKQRKEKFLFQKNIRKPFFISTSLAATQPHLFQDGDGDGVFY